MGQVELVTGTAIEDLDVVRNNHRVWEDGVRSRRDTQRAKLMQHAGVALPRAVEVDGIAQVTTELDVTQAIVPSDQRSGTVNGTRHRKQLDPSVVVGAA